MCSWCVCGCTRPSDAFPLKCGFSFHVTLFCYSAWKEKEEEKSTDTHIHTLANTYNEINSSQATKSERKKLNGSCGKKAAQPNRLNMETLVSAVQKPFDCIPFKTIYSRFKYALFMSISPALVYTRDALCVCEMRVWSLWKSFGDALHRQHHARSILVRERVRMQAKVRRKKHSHTVYIHQHQHRMKSVNRRRMKKHKSSWKSKSTNLISLFQMRFVYALSLSLSVVVKWICKLYRMCKCNRVTSVIVYYSRYILTYTVVAFNSLTIQTIHLYMVSVHLAMVWYGIYMVLWM